MNEKKIIVNVNDIIFLKEDNIVDLKQLKGSLKKFYRIRVNKIRILFEVENNEIQIIMIVNDIDFRGDIYK